MGLLRLILAMAVVLHHVVQPNYLGIRWINGTDAVTVFFIISGFYMALVLNEKYSTRESNSVFYANRALRLYPVYAVSVFLMIVMKLHYGSWGDFWQRLFELPPALAGSALFSNVVIVGQDWIYVLCNGRTGVSCLEPWKYFLAPHAWSIGVELIFYAMAPYFLRSAVRTLGFLAAGMVYQWITSHVAQEDFMHHAAYNYFFSPSSFLYFGLGASSYHFIYRRLLNSDGRWNVKEYMVAAAIIVTLAFMQPSFLWYWAVLYTGAVALLFHLTKYNALDRFIGELSYPIYMLHLPIVDALKQEIERGRIAPDLHAPLALATTLAASLLVFFLIERPLDRWRHRRSAIRLARE